MTIEGTNRWRVALETCGISPYDQTAKRCCRIRETSAAHSPFLRLRHLNTLACGNASDFWLLKRGLHESKGTQLELGQRLVTLCRFLGAVW